jgi:hypothetical protein
LRGRAGPSDKRERHGGKPRVVISLRLNLPLLRNESAQALRQRVRDEALRYLDIA